MRLSKIELRLENCDVITLNNKEIEYLSIDNIKKNIWVQSGDAYDKTYCDSFSIVLNKSANRKYYEFEQNDTEFEANIFERLKDRDITSIKLYYDNDTNTEDIYIPYKDDVENQLGSANVYMTYEITKQGNMLIIIDQKETVNSVNSIANIQYYDYDF